MQTNKKKKIGMNSQHMAYLEGWLSIGINTVLFAAKFAVGIMSGSIAVLADAWHTLSDSITSLVVIAGAWYSEKPQDEEHPFGHGRAESIASIIIGILLFVAAAGFLNESIKKLINANSFAFHPSIIVVFTVSVILKEGIARFSFWAGSRSGSMSLTADGWHHRSDAIASALILLTMFASSCFWWLDGVLGIAVSLLIGFTAFGILKKATGPLLGAPFSEEEVKAVDAIVVEEFGAGSVPYHYHVHRYGAHTEVTFHVAVSPSSTVQQIHERFARIEQRIYRELCMDATIRVDALDNGAPSEVSVQR